VEPIKATLKQGVPAIELDLWPSSAKDDIQVLHGKYVALLNVDPLDLLMHMSIMIDRLVGFVH